MFKLFLEQINLIPNELRNGVKMETDGISFKTKKTGDHKNLLFKHLTSNGWKLHPYSTPEHQTFTKDNSKLHAFHRSGRTYLSTEND